MWSIYHSTVQQTIFQFRFDQIAEFIGNRQSGECKQKHTFVQGLSLISVCWFWRISCKLTRNFIASGQSQKGQKIWCLISKNFFILPNIDGLYSKIDIVVHLKQSDISRKLEFGEWIPKPLVELTAISIIFLKFMLQLFPMAEPGCSYGTDGHRLLKMCSQISLTVGPT